MPKFVYTTVAVGEPHLALQYHDSMVEVMVF